MAVLVFATVMFAFSAWTAFEAALSGSVPAFTRHATSVLSYDQQPMSFGVTLLIWVGLSLFFGAAMLGTAKQLGNKKI